jgi:hypothetical protein
MVSQRTVLVVGNAIHTRKNVGEDNAIESIDEGFTMHGTSIETDFQHIEFETERMKRRLGR